MPKRILLSLAAILSGSPPGLSPFFPFRAAVSIDVVLSPFRAGRLFVLTDFLNILIDKKLFNPCFIDLHLFELRYSFWN